TSSLGSASSKVPVEQLRHVSPQRQRGYLRVATIARVILRCLLSEGSVGEKSVCTKPLARRTLRVIEIRSCPIERLSLVLLRWTLPRYGFPDLSMPGKSLVSRPLGLKTHSIFPRPPQTCQRLTTNHFIESTPDQHSSLTVLFSPEHFR